jgi:RNA polymerase sigma-B factor
MGSARDRAIEANLPLVTSLARRFANRGERVDDLVQVGAIGLINAVDRFDARRGVDLRAYAVPTIVGEIKRHLRDHATTIRVPRRDQEAHRALRRARQTLSARLEHTPTWTELASFADLDERDLARAVDAERASRPLSLSLVPGPSEAAAREEGYEAGEDRALVANALERLDPRERRALGLSLLAGLSQREVASRLGISQSHASRLITRGLAKMRAVMDDRDEVCNRQDERLHS